MQPFEWQRMWLDKFPVTYLAEVLFRSAIIFFIVLLAVKLTGKRGVRQLSVFELVIILTLGSAAGDVTFYEDVPFLPVLMVFVGIIAIYKFTTWLIDKSSTIEKFIEGRPIVIIREGKFVHETLEAENISHDEFLMELRLHNVSQLGQVKLAILEVNGDISVFYYPPDQTRAGLPILPEPENAAMAEPDPTGLYACFRCGHTSQPPAGSGSCEVCKGDRWLKADISRRIT
jgi:uncharacterized membrane protein YcaP (DUF421 family)